MPGDDWQRFANLRAYYGFMWGHPGKKLLFMGQEFAQPGEWNHDSELPWDLLDDARHAGVQRLVRDLNRLYRAQPALHRLDCEAHGFEWLDADDAEQSVYAWLRRDGARRRWCWWSATSRRCRAMPIASACRTAPRGWREVLNTDASPTAAATSATATRRLPVEAHRRRTAARSRCTLDVPPLATMFLVPA